MKSAIASIIIILLCVWGWGSNLYKLTQCNFDAPYKCEVLRTIGIIPPIGIFMGYFDIDDK